jgi:hypothetical protein
MKTHLIESIYVISIPFKYNSERGKLFHLILGGLIIISGIKKQDISLIETITTKGDNIYNPKTVRVRVISRHISLEKVEKIINNIISEVKVMFEKTNIENTKIILKNFN